MKFSVKNSLHIQNDKNAWNDIAHCVQTWFLGGFLNISSSILADPEGGAGCISSFEFEKKN